MRIHLKNKFYKSIDMKKSLIIVSVVLITVSISAFAITSIKSDKVNPNKESQNPTALVSQNFLATVNVTTVDDLTYKLDSRFIHNVTLENIRNAKSIKDIIPQKEAESLSNYSKNRLTIMLENGESIEYGNGETFTLEQLNLLSKVDYSTNLYIKADCKTSNEAGDLFHYDLVYYMTVIPEKEASFVAGNDALIEQVKARTKNKVAHVKMNNIKPGKVRFTVNKEGKISHAELESTCGYEDLDESLIQIFNSIEGDWNPAMNSQGEAVEQELVFFFGVFGC